MIITSKSNSTVKEIASLKDKKFRKKSGTFVVEGYKMVNEAIRSGKEIRLLVATEEAVKRFEEYNLKTLTVTDEVFSFLSDAVTPQGVLAVLKEEQKSPIKPTKPSVLLDGVSDPGNMGTIIRTCAAVGVEDVYLVDCCDPFSPKAVRSSMSGIFFVNLYFLKREEVKTVMGDTPIIVADMNGENVFTFNPPNEYCLVIGNEANGVSNEIEEIATHTVKIPMKQTSESLNAGISLAVTLYELTEGKGKSLI
ncbi:MAG: RNA methyltransferase [Clostridiales bacterium]|nr:RNA methyltransferase [Clostridiales bacterium]